MNYRQLEAFRAVMEAGTVIGASHLLSISQPSVSAHVANLEHALKIRLFVRRKGRLVPTAEALLLQVEVNEITKGLRRLERLAGDIQQLEAGQLTIGAYPALSSIVLPRFVGEFARRHPKARLTLMPETSVRIAELVSTRQIDVGLIAMPVIHPATTCDLIFETASVCVLPPGHALEAFEDIDATQIRGETFIALGREDGSRQAVERSLDEAGVHVEARYETHFGDTACALVAQGLGMSVVDPFAAERWEGRIAVRPFRPRVLNHVYLTHNRTHVSSLLQQKFEGDIRLFLEASFLR